MMDSMVKAPMIVKAKKVGQSDEDFYLEFELTQGQVNGLVAEMMLAHISNNTLTINHIYESNSEDKLKVIDAINHFLKENTDMAEQTRHQFHERVLQITREIQEEQVETKIRPKD